MKIKDIQLSGFTKITDEDALLVVDMQNDFIPGGALAVDEGDEIIPGINELIAKFRQSENPVVLTQDWHPAGHSSFASSHSGKKPYDPYETNGIGPVLWPDHCVQGTHGASFAPMLNTVGATMILRKGLRKSVDSYSAFLENDKKTETGLKTYLEAIGVIRIFICGLAADYCVFFSAIDGINSRFDVVVVLDLTRPVNSPENSMENALDKMVNDGVVFIELNQILD
ncbi:MAG: bifunctional nicotinamidase/pyrazinamidase [Candidatus Hodarchaeales archaeon]